MLLDPIVWDVLRDYDDSPCGGVRAGDAILWDEEADSECPATLIRIVTLRDVNQRMLASAASRVIQPRNVALEDAISRLTSFVWRPSSPARDGHASGARTLLRLARTSGAYSKPDLPRTLPTGRVLTPRSTP